MTGFVVSDTVADDSAVKFNVYYLWQKHLNFVEDDRKECWLNILFIKNTNQEKILIV